MADTSIQSIRVAIANTDRKVVLAFFLTIVAAGLTVWMGNMLIGKTVDAGTAALISGIVMLFVKMAADANGYQTQSSAGSDKKDETLATSSKALADKVPAQPAVVAATPTPDQLAESMLSNGELAYFKSITDDEAKKAFLAMSAAERIAAIGKV